MSVLDRKLGRDLLAARATLAAILLVVVVGVATFVGIASAYGNLERARRDYYTRCRMADFTVDLRKAPRAAVARLSSEPGVAEVQGRIVFDTVIDVEDAPRPITGLVVSLPDDGTAVINDIVLRRGGHFTDTRLEEVIVEDAFARKRGLHPGDTLHVILNSRRQELFVVGTAISSEFTYPIQPGTVVPDPANYGILWVKPRFAEQALDFDGAFNQVIGLLTPEQRARPRRVLDRLERTLASYGVLTATPRSEQASHRFLADEIAGLRVMTFIMPAVFLGIAALILNILMMRMAEQQRSVVGTLKALGYGRGAIRAHYLKFGLVVGLIGAALGMVLGAGLAEGMTVMYRRFFEFPRLESRLGPGVLVVAVVISAVFAVLGTWRGVRTIVRLGPAEAMRPQPPAEGGAIALERWRRPWRALGFRWQMVARSIMRYRWRTGVGLAAAACGSAIMLLAFYFDHALDYGVNLQFDRIVRADMDLVLGEERDERVVREARRLPAVDRAEPLLVVACEIRRGHRARRTAITGVDAGATLTIPRDEHGERIAIPPTGLVMSRKLADLLDTRVGDEVTMTPIRGRREPRRVPITRVTESFIGMATYADRRYLNRLIGEADAVSVVQLELRDDTESRRALNRRLKRLPLVEAINDHRESRANLVRTLLDTMKYSIGTLIGLAGTIYFGSILTVAFVSLAERRREVATFMVMGFSSREVGGIFLRETMLVNTIGAIAGLPLGIALVYLLAAQYDTEVYRMPVVLPLRGFVLSIGLAVLFTLAAHALVQRTINRLDWLDAINARE